MFYWFPKPYFYAVGTYAAWTLYRGFQFYLNKHYVVCRERHAFPSATFQVQLPNYAALNKNVTEYSHPWPSPSQSGKEEAEVPISFIVVRLALCLSQSVISCSRDCEGSLPCFIRVAVHSAAVLLQCTACVVMGMQNGGWYWGTSASMQKKGQGNERQAQQATWGRAKGLTNKKLKAYITTKHT